MDVFLFPTFFRLWIPSLSRLGFTLPNCVRLWASLSQMIHLRKTRHLALPYQHYYCRLHFFVKHVVPFLSGAFAQLRCHETPLMRTIGQVTFSLIRQARRTLQLRYPKPHTKLELSSYLPC